MRQYFHRLGHGVCETCRWEGSRAGLYAHLDQHLDDPECVTLRASLLADMDRCWNQAATEGRASVKAAG